MARPILLLLAWLTACSSTPQTSAASTTADVPSIDTATAADASPVADSSAPDLGDAADTDADLLDLDVPISPFCGDDACDDGESAAACPADCAVSPAAACLEQACATRLGACRALPACAATYDCLLACATTPCASACVSAASGGVIDLLELTFGCGIDAGCIAAPARCGDGDCDDSETAASCPADCLVLPACGDGLCGLGEDPVGCPEDCGSGPVCGDGTCEDDESTETCPTDCPLVGCGDATCARDETAASCPKDCAPKSCVGHCDMYEAAFPCQCDAGCADFGDCCPDLEAACTAPVCGDAICGKAEACPADCDAPVVCGDSACAPGESCEADCGPTSCTGICGTYADGAACQCDAQCVGFGDCCGDYGPLCTPAPSCGDAVCDFLETRQSCPGDCASVPPAECLAKKCPITVCDGSDVCKPGLACVAACPDLACALGCVFATAVEFQPALSGVAGCADSKGCFAPAATCGDTLCAPSEAAAACPADCSPPLGLECVTAACATPSCTADPECTAGLTCAAACQGTLCVDACVAALPAAASSLLSDLVTCARTAGCPNVEMTQ